MNNTARIFNCIYCQRQTIICTYCDRGNIYCGPICAKQSRAKNHRISNRVYQKTFRGKQKHAIRQRNYRLRQKQKVTDQGSALTSQDDLLLETKNKNKCSSKKIIFCDFCHTRVPDFFRTGYLDHSRYALGP